METDQPPPIGSSEDRFDTVEIHEIVSDVDRPLRVFNRDEHRETTARWLAIALVGILAATFLIHYAFAALAGWMDKKAASDAVKSVFDVWLPVIASLASAAVTYYFTREHK